MKITIIGAGNGGQAMAGHLSLSGHNVTLYNREKSGLKIISETKKIRLYEALRGTGVLDDFTSDIEYALRDAEMIMVTTTADAHKEVAKLIGPFVRENQMIVLHPGRTLGALEFYNELILHTTARFYLGEAQSLLYACRAEKPGNVRVIGVKNKVLFSAYPAKDTDYILERLNAVYPCYIRAESLLQTGLENIGAILHPSVILFNAASIERGALFFFYNDMTPSVANFLIEIDKERMSIGKAFGIEVNSVSDWISKAYKNIEGDSLCDKMRNNPAYFKILAPDTLHGRLMLEDIPTGILPMVELAKLAEIEVPLLHSVLNISEALLGKEFRNSGRTLSNLGLQGLSKDELIQQLK